MIVLCEGMDGVGKSTLAKALTEHLHNTCVLASPSHNGTLGKLIRSVQDTKPFIPAAMVHLYIAEQLMIEDDLKVIHPKVRRHVILDRHCMTSGPAYRPEPWSVLWPILNLGGTFQKPDLGVVLVASPATIRARLTATNHPIPWTDETIQAISDRLTKMVQRFALKTIVIDVEADPPVETLVLTVRAAMAEINLSR